MPAGIGSVGDDVGEGTDALMLCVCVCVIYVYTICVCVCVCVIYIHTMCVCVCVQADTRFGGCCRAGDAGHAAGVADASGAAGILSV